MRLLVPWMKAGKLPALARLASTGASGPLRSTIRPESSVAWSSFATGVNAGQHGIFGFAGFVQGTYRTRLMTASDLRATTFWEHAAAQGIRVGVFNVPLVSYPPRPLPEGSFSVGGLITPNLDSNFTWPSDLKANVLANVSNYRLDVDEAGLRDEEMISELAELTQQHLAAARYLIRSRLPELFVVVFMATDRIQHHLWRHLDSKHPRYDPIRSLQLASRILELYCQLDTAVGELMALAAPDALTVVLSDHGFNGCYRALSVNAWLASKGWLVPKVGAGTRGSVAHGLRWLRQVPNVRRLKQVLPGLRKVSMVDAWRPDPTAWIDWGQTQAFFSDVGGIRINLRGREPQGIVAPKQYDGLREQLVNDLLTLRDPQTGAAPITAVYQREELYSGPYVPMAPDLIVEPRRDANDPRNNYMLAYGASPTGALFSEPAGLNGNHDLDGILLAAGPGVEPGPITEAHLWDLAPTLCQALGIPLPPALDGRVIPQLVTKKAVNYGPTMIKTSEAKADGLSTKDEATVADRLRALGYLS